MLDKKIGEFTVGHLLKRAKEVVEDKTKGSVFLDVHAEERIPKFKKEGRLPQVGCFSLVSTPDPDQVFPTVFFEKRAYARQGAGPRWLLRCY
jgi:hypothetical protein